MPVILTIGNFHKDILSANYFEIGNRKKKTKSDLEFIQHLVMVPFLLPNFILGKLCYSTTVLFLIYESLTRVSKTVLFKCGKLLFLFVR